MSGDERVGVRTYVPRYQRDIWDEEADRHDMSRSEFVRTMVQAGRRELGLDGPSGNGKEVESGEGSRESDPVPRDGVDMKGRVDDTDVTNRVLDLLRGGESLDWDELVALLTDDVEDRLEDALETLQNENRVQYDGRAGGYTLVEDGRE